MFTKVLSLVLVGAAAGYAALTTPPVIHVPSSIIHLPDPSVIHLPASAIPARRTVIHNLLAAPRSASRLSLPMGTQPAGLLSWSGASTFRALAIQTFAVARQSRCGSGTMSSPPPPPARRLGWEPRAGLLSWRGASNFRALVKRNTCLAVQTYGCMV